MMHYSRIWSYGLKMELRLRTKTKLHQQKQLRVRGKSKVRKHQVYCQTKVPLVVRQGGPSPNLRVGYKLNLPTMTIDNYDAWYECVESCDYGEVPVDHLPLDEYNKIIKECYDGVDSEEEEVSDHQEGVIDLEDYIVELQKDKEWVKKHHLCLL